MAAANLKIQVFWRENFVLISFAGEI